MGFKTIKDLLLFLAYYGGGVITVYFLPNIVAFAYFAILIVLFYRSEKDWFWFALIFAFVDPPGGLFPNGDVNFGLPFLTKPVILGFQEIFYYVALFKALRSKNKPQFRYKGPFIILMVYILILFVFSFIIGVSWLTAFKVIKWVLPWSLIYSITVLVKKRDEWQSFFALLFIMTLVAFGSQLLQIALGTVPASYLGSEFMRIDGIESIDSRTRSAEEYIDNPLRPIASPFIVISALMAGMFYLTTADKKFKSNYLLSILFVCMASIYLTATRGWIISVFISFVLFALFMFRNLKKTFGILIPLILFMVIINFMPILRKQIMGSTQRLFTLEAITKGDYSAGGTVDRYTEYTPYLIKIWKESPILGLGFSDRYWTQQNGHAGHANLLMNGGILGYLIFLYLWIMMVAVPFSVHRKISNVNFYKRGIFVLLIWFLFFFIVHSTSGQQFRFLADFGGGAFGQALFFAFSEFLFRDAPLEEKMLKHRQNVLKLKQIYGYNANKHYYQFSRK